MERIIKRAKTMILNYKGNACENGFCENGFSENDNEKTYFAFFKTISIDFTNWMCSSIRVKHFCYPNGHVLNASELDFVQKCFGVLLNMPTNERCKYLLKDNNFPNAVAFLMYDERVSSTMIVTYVVINEGSRKKLFMFVDEYKTGVACWGSKAKLMLENAGHFVGGRYHHMFYDY